MVSRLTNMNINLLSLSSATTSAFSAVGNWLGKSVVSFLPRSGYFPKIDQVFGYFKSNSLSVSVPRCNFEFNTISLKDFENVSKAAAIDICPQQPLPQANEEPLALGASGDSLVNNSSGIAESQFLYQDGEKILSKSGLANSQKDIVENPDQENTESAPVLDEFASLAQMAKGLSDEVVLSSDEDEFIRLSSMVEGLLDPVKKDFVVKYRNEEKKLVKVTFSTVLAEEHIRPLNMLSKREQQQLENLQASYGQNPTKLAEYKELKKLRETMSGFLEPEERDHWNTRPLRSSSKENQKGMSIISRIFHKKIMARLSPEQRQRYMDLSSNFSREDEENIKTLKELERKKQGINIRFSRFGTDLTVSGCTNAAREAALESLSEDGHYDGADATALEAFSQYLNPNFDRYLNRKIEQWKNKGIRQDKIDEAISKAKSMVFFQPSLRVTIR